VPSSLAARHAARYAALARLLLEHREAAFAANGREPPTGGAPGEAGGDEAALAESASQLVEELQAMGPTFVKLGQLLSTRPDVISPVYVEALARLRDDVEQLAPGEAVGVVERELGVRVSKGFSSFDPEPLGSASLGQVHRAALRDGRPVAVKVQRPGAEAQVVEDMEVVAELAGWLDEHSRAAHRLGFVQMVEEFRRTVLTELDYRSEASNLRLLRENLQAYSRIVVPLPVDDYCSRRVLTMELVDGRSIASIGPLAKLDLDERGLADELFRAYLDQVLVRGFFHSDPHPGNVLLTSDGRLALIDAGQVARLTKDTREQLLRLLLAVSDGDGAHAAAILEDLGDRLEGYDGDELRRRVSDVVERASAANLGNLDAGVLLGELARASAENGLRPAREVTLVAKMLLSLDEVARVLDPEFDPVAAIHRHVAHLMRHGMLDAASPAHLLTAMLDGKAFIERLPGRMNKVLDALAEGRFTLNVQGVDEAELMRVGQKLANRLATGVVIAALLLTAGLFDRGGGHASSVWGYPVLTVVFLLLGAAATLWMLVGILRSDLPQARRRRERRQPG
jgi:ubiquinone biosynthesis protein